MMRLLKLAILGLAALLALSPPVSAHGEVKPQPTDAHLPVLARSAAAAVDAFHASLSRGDTHSAAALLAEDALIFEEGGVERNKAEYVARHLPADAAFSKTVSSAVTRQSG